MNILYIFGNGFDLAQKMNTSYPEFYKHLMTIKEKTPLLNRMTDEIKANTKEWADMEDAFGEFTATIENPEDFINLYKELSSRLQEYLTIQENKFEESLRNNDGFYKNFLNPFGYLEGTNKKSFENFKKTLPPSRADYIDVMTFNYTRTLEKFLQKKKNNNETPKLRETIHIHGQLGDSIIIGVDNEGQIANAEFRKNDDVKDFLVKSQSNYAMKESREEACEELIAKANVIFLYGVSLGETDDKWWKLIKETLKTRKDVAVILHIYEPNIPGEFRQEIGRFERAQRKNYLKRFGINEEDYNADYKNRFYFMINSAIFNSVISIEPLPEHINKINCFP